ncbi:MAG: hypothetical protein KUG77_26310, partial [Nannocystaceae bacterium]|nr:hypothetical protein [Nannocystaceae bacterium]
MVAITGAGNPVFRNLDANTATSFQVAQTRFGFKVNEAGKAGGTIELDLIDFNKSSAAVSARPRVRIATVDWKPKKNHKLTFGQTWDLYGALQSYHYNWVGNHYYNGQSAFMRHQAIYLYSPKRFEVGAAVGLPGLQNNAVSLGAMESNLMPTFATRAAFKFGEGSRVGVSAIYTNLKYEDTRRDTASGLAFLDVNLKNFNIRGEGYVGQNLGNIGALTLSYGREDTDMIEAGGWGALKYATEKHCLLYT